MPVTWQRRRVGCRRESSRSVHSNPEFHEGGYYLMISLTRPSFSLPLSTVGAEASLRTDSRRLAGARLGRNDGHRSHILAKTPHALNSACPNGGGYQPIGPVMKLQINRFNQTEKPKKCKKAGLVRERPFFLFHCLTFSK